MKLDRAAISTGYPTKAGSDFLEVARTRVILEDIENWNAAINFRKQYFRDARPVDTILATDRSPNPEWQVGLEAGAINGGSPRPGIKPKAPNPSIFPGPAG